MQYTPNLNLKKPDYGDIADIPSIVTNNMDILDTKITDIEKAKYLTIGPTTSDKITLNNSVKGQVNVDFSGNSRINILTENQANVEYGLEGINSAGSTLSVTTNEKAFGFQSLKVVTDGSAGNEGFFLSSVSALPNKTYTASAYLKGSGTVKLELSQRDSSDTAISSGTQIVTLTSTWQKVSVTFNFGINGVKARLLVRTDLAQSITFYADGMMIEESDTVKPFITGVKSTVMAQKLTSVGKNIFDESNSIYSDTGRIRATWNGKKIVLNNSINTANRAEARYTMFFQNGETYIAKKFNENIINGSAVLVQLTNVGETLIAQAISPNVPFVFSLPSGYYDISFYTNAGSLQNIELNVVLYMDSTAILYEPYKSDKTYILCTNSETGEIEEARSVPNGTRDRLYYSNGKYYSEKNTEKVILDGNLTWTGLYTFTNTYRMYLDNYCIANNMKQSIDNSGIGYCSDGNFGVLANADLDKRNISMGYTTSNGRLYINIEKAKVDAMTGIDIPAKFKAYLNQYPITLNYQYSEDAVKTYNLSTSPLTCYENGTVIFEKVIPEVTVSYDSATGCSVTHTEYPIHFIDFIRKVNKLDGSYIELDKSKAVIAANKLSFTHSDLVEGDLVDWDYYYPPELSTDGEKTVTYPINAAAALQGALEMITQMSKDYQEYKQRTDAHLLDIEARLALSGI
ncbi:phage head spike fiber domain-containing protein [Brassicibacter mesophilus]|uniref:phage head spike fiber domain-containing protein n=1 Tax=Brassicibacter mesophilus TaxID=745119 RepID=UPI003D2089E7